MTAIPADGAMNGPLGEAADALGAAPAVPVPRVRDAAGDRITVRMMEVHGQKLRVATSALPDGASDDRPPLLMFNGIGANLEVAYPFFDALRKTRGIIFDVPGVGGSPMPALPYRAGTIARLARGVVEQLGYDEVDVSGVSWGGGMAQQFAYQYPRIARRLVLTATSAGWVMVPGRPNVLSKMASVRRYTEPGYMREIAGEIYGGDFRGDREAIAPHIRAVKPVTGAGYALQLLAMTGWTSVHWLWRLRQPTLILSGTDDPLIPVANARLLHRLIPNSTLKLLDNGHLFMVTRPGETAGMVEDFLGRS